MDPSATRRRALHRMRLRTFSRATRTAGVSARLMDYPGRDGLPYRGGPGSARPSPAASAGRMSSPLVLTRTSSVRGRSTST